MFLLRNVRKMLKYSVFCIFLTRIFLLYYENFVDLQRDLETRMLN